MYGDCSCYDCAANLCDAICDGMGFVDKRIAFTRSLRSETGDKMPGWPSEERYEVIKTVFGDEVSCYMDGRFGIKKWNKFHVEKYQKDREGDFESKTVVIDCGSTDGEQIDLFELQDWFDKNRAWINQLREKAKQ